MPSLLNTLRAARAKLITDAQALLAPDEVSAEIHAQIDAMLAEADRIEGEIRRHERLDASLRSLDERVALRAGRENISPDEQRDRDESVNGAFRSYMRFGMDGLNEDQRRIMNNMRTFDPQAAQSVGTGAGGGYLVAPAFLEQLEIAMRAFGGMLNEATEITTTTGALMPMPTSNDTNNRGSILAENTQAATLDIQVGQVNLNAFKYTSGVVLVSLELLQDSAFDIDGFVAGRLGERIARIWNNHFTTGTGLNQPNGVATAATIGKTGVAGQTTSVIYDDLVDLMHSVDPAYRDDAKYMMSDAALKVVKKLKDTTGRPIFTPYQSIGESTPDTILGKPFVINQDVAVMAASAKSILFGNFKKYIIRRVMGIMIQRLVERYADVGQVGFIGFARADGQLLDAGTHPIAAYQNSAT